MSSLRAWRSIPASPWRLGAVDVGDVGGFGFGQVPFRFLFGGGKDK